MLQVWFWMRIELLIRIHKYIALFMWPTAAHHSTMQNAKRLTHLLFNRLLHTQMFPLNQTILWFRFVIPLSLIEHTHKRKCLSIKCEKFIVKLSNGCENAWERLRSFSFSFSSFCFFSFWFFSLVCCWFFCSFNRCCQTCCFFITSTAPHHKW